MDPAYTAYYRQLYENHWWFRMRERWIVQALRQNLPPGGWGTILDVGCGDGLFFDRLAEFGEVEGIETSREIVDTSNPHFQKIYIGPFDGSFRPGKEYSLILLLDVLEHIPEPLDALRRCVSMLKPGGSLFLTVPAFNLVWTNHDVVNHHVTRYRRATLFPLLQRAGFTVEDSRYWFQWTFPVKMAERLVEKLFHLPPKNPVIPSPPINRALCRLCSIERSTIGQLRPPFGTTLFVRCRKSSSSRARSGPSAG